MPRPNAFGHSGDAISELAQQHGPALLLLPPASGCGTHRILHGVHLSLLLRL
jgi:hypothetical protein